MKFAICLAVVLLAGAFLPRISNAQPGGSREQLEWMFTNISKNAKWDMSKDMLWGYFFTNRSRGPLDLAAKSLSRSGYRIVDIYLEEKDAPAAPDVWWLHVERVETHSIETLLRRNAELSMFAKNHKLDSYDGMDVGPVEGRKK